MNELFEQFLEAIHLSADTAWVLQVFAVVFFTLIIGMAVNRMLKRLHTKLKKTRNPWDDEIVRAAKRPAQMMVWLVGLTFAVEVVYKESDIESLSAIYPIRDVAVIGILTWFLNNLIERLKNGYVTRRLERGQEIDYTALSAVTKLLRAAVVITALLIVMQTLGFSVSGVMAFGGMGGIAIGFAARDLLANFFGALMIYFDKPFKMGDWVRSPDRDIEGTVEAIGWRQTVIRTFDKRPLYVPNSVFSTIAVENPARMTHRRINETVGVRYDDVGKLAKIVEDVKAMLVNHDEIDATQTMIVNVNKFSASSVDFFVYTFTKTTNWIKYHEVKQDVMLKIAVIVADNSAEIAFPTSTLHIPEGIAINQKQQEMASQ